MDIDSKIFPMIEFDNKSVLFSNKNSAGLAFDLSPAVIPCGRWVQQPQVENIFSDLRQK